MPIGKNKMFVLAAAALWVVFGLLGTVAADDSQPVVKVAEPEHNAGDVPKGGMIFHQFDLENQGNAPLIIEKVVAGCGCTSVDWDKEIAPGAIGHIVMTVEVEAEALPGPLSERILVKTNDPQSKVFSLYLTATVVD